MPCAPGSTAKSARTRSGTASRRICSRVDPICARCRSCSAMPASAPRSTTHTWIATGCARFTGSFIRADRVVRLTDYSPLIRLLPQIGVIVFEVQVLVADLVGGQRVIDHLPGVGRFEEGAFVPFVALRLDHALE